MIVPDFAGIRVLVVGDVMLDRYWHGDVTRISQEAPVPVVAVTRVEERAGGAANVAMNCAALGAKVMLASVIGDDDAGRKLGELVGNADRVQPYFDVDPAMQTTVKLRVLGQRQQMIRMDFEDAAPANKVVSNMMRNLPDLVKDCDIVIASDYAKGVLGWVQDLIQMAKAFGKPVFVDPKGKSWAKYAGAELVKPNSQEFASLSNLRDLHQIGAMLLTEGADGMTLEINGGDAHHQAAYKRDVADVTGAGDTVMAVVACMRAAGRPWPKAMNLASKAAGIVVGRLGTAAITRQELIDA